MEAGMIEKWVRNHWPKDTCRRQTEEVKANIITAEDIVGILLVLLCGIVLSLIILLFELTINHYGLKMTTDNR